MQTRRPAPVPLSDELFSKQAPLLLGHTNYDYCVKNTFLELPSGLTPSSTKVRNPLLTAPAGLNKKMALLIRTPNAVPTTPMTPMLTPSPVSQRFHGTSGTVLQLIQSPQREAITISPQREVTTMPPQREEIKLKPEIPYKAGLERIIDWADEPQDETEETEARSDDESPESQVQQLARDEVPKPPPDALHPSVGSIGHAFGACKRCCFFPRGRCMNGYECEFCHYSHENRKRKNRNKGSKQSASTMSFTSDVSRAAPSHGQVEMQQPMMTYSMGGDGASMTQVLVPMQSGMTMQGAMPMQGNMGAGHVVMMQPMRMCAAPAVQQAASFVRTNAICAQMVGAAYQTARLLGQTAVSQQQPQQAQPQLQPHQLLPQSQQESAKVDGLQLAMASQSSFSGHGSVLAPPPPAHFPKMRLTLASRDLGAVAPPPQHSPKFCA
mmetsp:Transcript_33602/g.85999  ORF Transcript_33602/g.85999 Transcript_33602/m.85999 type:complete len:438 (-) Transcript_33602:530-1843(-)